MNEHYCGVPSCFERVSETEVACGPHYALLPVELKIDLDNGAADRRRTGKTFMHIRSMTRAIAWLDTNVAPPDASTLDPEAIVRGMTT